MKINKNSIYAFLIIVVVFLSSSINAEEPDASGLDIFILSLTGDIQDHILYLKSVSPTNSDLRSQLLDNLSMKIYDLNLYSQMSQKLKTKELSCKVKESVKKDLQGLLKYCSHYECDGLSDNVLVWHKSCLAALPTQ